MNQLLVSLTFSKSSIDEQFQTVNLNVYCSHIVNFMNRPAFSQSKVVVWP
jgi:hypothetical protein